MHLANIMLALGGDKDNTIPKYRVTPAEIVVLRHIHGSDAVFDIEPLAETVSRTSREEYHRLTGIYGYVDERGNPQGPVAELFPGVGANLPQELGELGLDDSFYKAIARMTAPAPSAPPKGRKSKAAPAPEPSEAAIDDEIEDMPPVGNEPASIYA